MIFLSNLNERPEEKFKYFITSNVANCKLLPSDERIFDIPTGKDGMGQSNIWYADKATHYGFRVDVLEYIQGKKRPTKSKTKFNVNENKKIAVEKAAIQHVANYYQELGYEVISVEDENLGWDLEAVLDSEALKLLTEEFFWKHICDHYLEIIKDRLYNPDKRGKSEGEKSRSSILITFYK